MAAFTDLMENHLKKYLKNKLNAQYQIDKMLLSMLNSTTIFD
jgi:hypothetical protein